MSKLKIKTKLIISFIFLISISVTLSIFNYYISNFSEQSINRINHYNNIIDNAYTIQSASFQFVSIFNQLSNPLNDNLELRNSIYQDISIIRNTYLNSLQFIQENYKHELINNVNHAITEWRNYNNQILELSRLIDTSNDITKPELFTQLNTSLNNNRHYQQNTIQALNNLIDYLGNNISNLTTLTHNKLLYFKTISGILLILVLLTLFFAYVIIKSITSTLSFTIDNLNNISNDISIASNELSESSSVLSESSSEQAASIEETSASLEEISAMVKTNTQNISQTVNLMNSAAQKINDVNSSIIQLESNIKTINNSSSEIVKIIKLIDDIAFQVNLLSLNASVEAARAGEAGNSFGVVAQEVRALAIRAAESSKNINQLITNIVTDITKTTNSIDIVNSTFNELKDTNFNINTLIQEVNHASQEQALGIEQINIAISEIDKVTQIIASGSEETASFSIELKNKIDTLKEIVENLKKL